MIAIGFKSAAKESDWTTATAILNQTVQEDKLDCNSVNLSEIFQVITAFPFLAISMVIVTEFVG